MIFNVNGLDQNLYLLQLRVDKHYEVAKLNKKNCKDFNLDLFFLNHINDLIDGYLRGNIDYTGREVKQ